MNPSASRTVPPKTLGRLVGPAGLFTAIDNVQETMLDKEGPGRVQANLYSTANIPIERPILAKIPSRSSNVFLRILESQLSALFKKDVTSMTDHVDHVPHLIE